MKYYQITKDLNYHDSESWQLLNGNVIQDTGTGNMFIAKSIGDAMKGSFQQLNAFEMDLVRIYIKHRIDGIKLVS